MSRVLVLGAGLVSRPLVDYLMERTDAYLAIADINLDHARGLVGNSRRGEALALDAGDPERMAALVGGSDVVVSLLPYPLHPGVARHCLEAGVPMLNASYVSPEMSAMDAAARGKGILLLCEMGLDPGIDHMSAMRIIHDVQSRGGRVTSFKSVCGGLPAPEAADNPFGYKFSWSPAGVLMAGNNPARYQEDGHLIEIPGETLFDRSWDTRVDGMDFEAYPNRDSIPYAKLYGLEHLQSILRGTLRNRGWSRIMSQLKVWGLTSGEAHGLKNPFSPVQLVEAACGDTPDWGEMEAGTRKALQWLGLKEEGERLWHGQTFLDCLAELMSEKMSYATGERDMVVLHHDFVGQFPDHREFIHSSLVAYGIPGGPSAMARTVSLPLAIATRGLLEGKIVETGVRIPVEPEIYEPVLEELDTLGIRMVENIRRESLSN